ncbi:MAG: hypothetical protein ACP5XB_12090, partial [Isosphaeraceae bacterium]
RKHDQPRLPAHQSVGLTFTLVASLVLTSYAQDGMVAAAPGASDPIDLTARQIQVWDGRGERWAVLSGDVAILQGPEGLRCRGAVVRIVEVPVEDGKVFEAEVYAEGNVRLAGRTDAPRAEFRARIRSAKGVQLSPYEAQGITQLKEPPRGLLILERSGLASSEQAQAASGSRQVPRRQRQPLATSAPTAAEADPRAVPDRPDVSPLPAPPDLEPVPEKPAPKRDPQIERAVLVPASLVETQTQPPAGGQTRPAAPPATAQPADEPPMIDLPPIEGAQDVEVPNLGNHEDVPRAQPLPGATEDQPAPPIREDETKPKKKPAPLPTAPLEAGSFRVTKVRPRSGRKMDVQILRKETDGTQVILYRNGVNIVTRTPSNGILDIEAESAVIWKHPAPKKGEQLRGPNGEWIDKPNQPMEVYLEGDVILRQDDMKTAGKGDQKTFRAKQAYYDFVTDRVVALQAEVDIFAPGFIAPMKVKSPRIEQFHQIQRRPDGTLVQDPDARIRADNTIMTGSRFPNPAYQINNRAIDLTRSAQSMTEPNSGRAVGNPNDPNAPMDVIWKYDARQNVFWMGWLPIFYWPRFVGETDDLEAPFRQFSFRSNNYFGQQVLTDWSGFKMIGVKRPGWIDNWNIDIDYLSARTKDFPALGSEMGWFGSDLIRDLTDPYHKIRTPGEHITYDYFGYFDIWGLKDGGNDVLGSGPAIVTNGPPGAGKRGYQRFDVPPFQQVRGRFNFRHMQRFLPDDDEHKFEDLRLQVETAYVSDRHFLEEYYKRLNETGLDQETLAYGQWQKNNTAWTLWGEVNLQNFYTDTQWLPRVDSYRLGDSFLNHWFNYSEHTGVDYANVHTDIMVNNPNLFAFMPYDPISNTSGPFSAARAYTNHEIDMPLNIYDVVRVMPYLQGQIVGWSNQIGGGPFHQQSTGPMARFWGAAGLHTETTLWKMYPDVENEILNIHGLNNKISLYSDFRAAYANQQLNSIAVQDDLDDNEYEFVRRYFAITSWTGGILPTNYDPRFLILRRALSPITGPTDIQASITTLQLGIHQRLQTKRGPEGKRRIVDWMTLDLNGTYFPDAKRDNFGTPWGQTMYNYQWFLGDRTSIISYGWFDYWNLTGSQVLSNYNVPGFNPKGLNVVTTGISLSRPPRANIFIGYTVINTGPINTSALNMAISYWLSPKWYGSFSTSYDFGNRILLGSMFSFTRIGKDYLTSIGLTVDPQRQSTMFAVQISPRLSPNMQLGSGVGMTQFDSRYAPAQ